MQRKSDFNVPENVFLVSLIKKGEYYEIFIMFFIRIIMGSFMAAVILLFFNGYYQNSLSFTEDKISHH